MTHTPFGQHTNKLTALLEKTRGDKYKDFLSRKTIHINADTTPIVDKLTRYSPVPPPRSFTMRVIPDRFRCRPPDSPPQSFAMFLIPDWFGDFPT